MCTDNDSCTKKSLSEEDPKLLHIAYLLTKTVPQQTNRCKWHKASGYTPCLLSSENHAGMIKGDMLFFDSYDGLVYLRAEKDTLLVRNDDRYGVNSPTD